jgi:DNA-binding NtrC family response regulator
MMQSTDSEPGEFEHEERSGVFRTSAPPAANLREAEVARVVDRAPDTTLVAELPEAGIDLRNAVEVFENQLIRQALERTNWNKKQAASLLGLNRTTLVEMLKRKRIRPDAA